MAQPAARTLDAGPRHPRRRSRTILRMQNASPIRRYVLLRHRELDASTPRWSMERIGPTPRDGAPAPSAPPRPSRARR
jgi:hypothetical protein